MQKDAYSFNIEKKTLAAMVSIYCRKQHQAKDRLCPDCGKLQDYALQKLEQCVFGAKKPNCVHCPIHCYEPVRRQQIQKVMRHSGPLMLRYHPMLAVVHIARRLRNRPIEKRSIKK